MCKVFIYIYCVCVCVVTCAGMVAFLLQKLIKQEDALAMLSRSNSHGGKKQRNGKKQKRDKVETKTTGMFNDDGSVHGNLQSS